MIYQIHAWYEQNSKFRTAKILAVKIFKSFIIGIQPIAVE